MGILAIILVVPWPLFAEAQETVVETTALRSYETEDQLIAMGCEKVQINDRQSLLAAESLGWQVVIPVDYTGQGITVCAKETIVKLQPAQDGQVAGIMNYIPFGLGNILEAGLASVGWVASEAARTANVGATAALETLFDILFNFSVKLFEILAQALVPLVTISSFGSSTVVRQTWPVMLGIANLGFLLGILVIALMVTLRLDNGSGVRRMLPRLLLGALLVNFSLVIGVVIIDISRLLNVLILIVFRASDPQEGLAGGLTTAVNFSTLSADISRNLGVGEWGAVTGKFIQLILGFMSVIALSVVIMGLLARYIMLIVLLILSPLAYLALVFPNFSNLSKSWWQSFLKYVFYGPAVLTILMVALRATDITDFSAYLDLTDARQSLAAHAIRIFILVAGLFMAAVSGRYAGIVGSAATLNAVSRVGARGRSVALSGLRGARRGAYTATGARAATKYAGGQLGMFGRTLGGNIITRIPGLRNLGGGTGKKIADTLVRKGRSPGDAAAATAARTQLRTGVAGTAGKLANPAFAPQNLRRRSVGEEMMRASGGVDVNIRPVFREGNLDQVRNFAKNQELGKLSGEQRINIVADLLINPQVSGMGANDRGKFVDEITRALEESNKQFTS